MSPQVFQALARDLKLDANGVQARLANEAKASKAELTLRKSLGATYGGAWLSADAKTFTVAVTSAAQADQVRAAGATPQLVKHSLAQLDAVKAALDAHAAKRTQGGARLVRRRRHQHRRRARPRRRRRGRVRQGERRRRRAPSASRPSTEDPRPLIDVIGGNAYYIGSGSRCSVGFSVNGGFVTAGHCGSTGATTTQPSGTFRGSSFPGNDYAWVQVAAGNTPRGAGQQLRAAAP